MAIYLCLMLLALSLVMLIWGNYSESRRKSKHFGVAVTFILLATVVMIVSAIRSLWLYPLN